MLDIVYKIMAEEKSMLKWVVAHRPYKESVNEYYGKVTGAGFNVSRTDVRKCLYGLGFCVRYTAELDGYLRWTKPDDCIFLIEYGGSKLFITFTLEDYVFGSFEVVSRCCVGPDMRGMRNTKQKIMELAAAKFIVDGELIIGSRADVAAFFNEAIDDVAESVMDKMPPAEDDDSDDKEPVSPAPEPVVKVSPGGKKLSTYVSWCDGHYGRYLTFDVKDSGYPECNRVSLNLYGKHPFTIHVVSISPAVEILKELHVGNLHDAKRTCFGVYLGVNKSLPEDAASTEKNLKPIQISVRRDARVYALVVDNIGQDIVYNLIIAPED